MSDARRRPHIIIANLGVELETVGGVTYPHHVFGPNNALIDGRTGLLLLPGARGEVFTSDGGSYKLQRIQERSE